MNDNKLELKDVCGYLPYDLMCYCNKYPKEPVNVTGLKNNGLFFFGKIGNADICVDEIKPIFRPMSDLTKEITHKGKKFVPIVELAKISFPKYWIIDNGCAESDTGWWFWYDEDTFSFAVYGTISNIVPNQLILFDKLSEWMFDYRGLIEKSLAINVNDLEVNPYE